MSDLNLDALPPLCGREFHDFLTTRGVRDGRTGPPKWGMSARTADRIVARFRKVLVDLGYLTRVPDGAGGCRYIGSQGRDPQRLGIPELVEYHRARFPAGSPDHRHDGRHNNYATAVEHWADFCHFEKGTWSEEKMKDLRARVPTRRLKVPEIDIEPPRRIDPWVLWLKEKWAKDRTGKRGAFYLRLYTMARFMGHLGGMRISEVLHAPWDLNGPTLKVEWAPKKATIWGKGRGGMSKDRKAPLFDEPAADLRAWQEWVGSRPELLALHVKHNRLFLNEDGRPYPTDAKIRYSFRRAAARYNEEVLVPRGEEPLDLKKIKPHAIGRHRFGTFWANKKGDRPPDKVIMSWMGVDDYPTFSRYVNVSFEEQVAEWGDGGAAGEASLDVQSRDRGAPPEPTNGAVLEELRRQGKLIEELTARLTERDRRIEDLTNRLLARKPKTRAARRRPG